MENDTCSCDLGYKGKLCTESGMCYCSTCIVVMCTVFTCVLHTVQCSEGNVEYVCTKYIRVHCMCYCDNAGRLYIQNF